MTNLRLCLPLLLCALCLPALAEPGVMQYYDFENDTKPWITLNPQAQLGLTAKQENVFAGTSSLELKYVFTPGATGNQAFIAGTVILPLAGGLRGMQAISLAFKSSATITAVVGGQQEGGQTWVAPFFAPAGAWQEVALGLQDFYPLDDANAPPPGAVFDPGKISGLGVIDASGALSTLTQKAPVTQFPAGARTLWLDEVKLLSTPLPPELGALPTPDAVPIDSCQGETIRWAVLGGRDWKAVREVDPGAPAGHYRFDYTDPAGTLVLWLKPLHLGQLAGTSALHLSVRSAQAIKLVVSVQEPGDVRYNVPVDLPAGGAWKPLTLPWSDFKLDQNSHDPAGKLLPERITGLGLADPTGMAGQPQDQKNTLWFSDLYATK